MTNMMFILLALFVMIVGLCHDVVAFIHPSFVAVETHANRNVWPFKMFTGIVEEMGVVQSLVERDDMILWDGSKGRGTELTVQGNVVLDGAYLGCSICVSGVCLTATALDPIQKTFTVGLAPETLRKTYFSSLHPGQAVNLERASEIGGRNSGHFVQGHVDGTGTIVRKQHDQDSLDITIQLDNPDLIKYIVPKGFIAIDGTSLTVVDVDPVAKTFSFMLIEYTQKKIIIPQKQIGDKVNLEVDVLGKYSETALAALIPRLEALEAKVETLERALLAGSSPSQYQSTASPMKKDDNDPKGGGNMIPPKKYQPPPKSTAVRPMGGVPKPTASYLQDEAEAFRRSSSPMARPVSRARIEGGEEFAASGEPKEQGAGTSSPDTSYLNQLENTALQSKQSQNLPPPQRRQSSISLNPEPPAASSQQHGRFISVPTGKGVPNTAHSQESLPDPLL